MGSDRIESVGLVTHKALDLPTMLSNGLSSATLQKRPLQLRPAEKGTEMAEKPASEKPDNMTDERTRSDRDLTVSNASPLSREPQPSNPSKTYVNAALDRRLQHFPTVYVAAAAVISNPDRQMDSRNSQTDLRHSD
ncbi:hypothetical protein M0804_005105 [Polistes exclamans]|nr:hypothetical protein M0804_005105 [Polistes exclamans]